MPRWKALPDELDPQIKEFTSQLRALVDRSGLSVAAVADRTGYSKTSWERYLGGRLLAPKGAIVALAEVTGTHPVHLTTMWELAERAWSRAEMRHDRTMEQIRISQARAALGEFGAAEAEAQAAGGTRTAHRGTGSPAVPHAAGPAGAPPRVPAQPTASDADDGERPGRGPAPEVNSWGLAGYEGPSRASGRPGTRPVPVQGGAGRPPVPPAPHGGQRPPSSAGNRSAKAAGGQRRLTVLLAGAGAVLVAVAAVFVLTHRGGGKDEGATKSPSPTATTRPSLPAGVKCAGSDCAGKDAETMGCSGSLVTTAKTATVGTTTLEVRYSRTCGAAWGRITGGAPGDQVRVSAGKARQKGDITTAGDTIAYTPMVAVKDAAEAEACATLASGQTGCTK
ncbi:XRE family transcriptional regulator [Streptomyces cellostaticus]|uniref:helix-turn-helix domain-containing protein n=1 Tax=Streptomyces TaxID=1883 RepID=UPI002026BE8B|nr:XRE family transcriptional regulator [Streptomyces cellostaticus]